MAWTFSFFASLVEFQGIHKNFSWRKKLLFSAEITSMQIFFFFKNEGSRNSKKEFGVILPFKGNLGLGRKKKKIRLVHLKSAAAFSSNGKTEVICKLDVKQLISKSPGTPACSDQMMGKLDKGTCLRKLAEKTVADSNLKLNCWDDKFSLLKESGLKSACGLFHSLTSYFG